MPPAVSGGLAHSPSLLHGQLLTIHPHLRPSLIDGRFSVRAQCRPGTFGVTLCSHLSWLRCPFQSSRASTTRRPSFIRRAFLSGPERPFVGVIPANRHCAVVERNLSRRPLLMSAGPVPTCSPAPGPAPSLAPPVDQSAGASFLDLRRSNSRDASMRRRLSFEVPQGQPGSP